MSDGVSENVVPFDAARRETPPSALQIVGHCRNLVTSHVERHLREMLDGTDDALFRLAEQAEDNRTQTEYFDAMREVRRRRSTMESEYPMQIAQLFDRFLRGAGTLRSRAQIDGELSLVETDELEENLALEGMISKATRLHDNEIYALTRRLAVALDRPKLAEDAHPLAPSSFCEAFRTTMQTLDVDLRVRLIIYKLFDKYVVSHFGEVLGEVNHYLAERGILPELKTRAGAAMNKSGRGGEAGGAYGGQHESGVAGGGEDSELMALLRHLSGGAGGGGAMPGMSGGMGGGVPGGATSGGGVWVEPKALLGAINTLPMGLGAVSSGPIAGEDLKGAILTAVNSGGGQALALNRVDETAIDIVAMLFDFIFEDPALPAPIKELIGRLQIPVLRVAIIDKSFFSRKKHPARRLLNELARAGIGWTEAEEREDGLRARIESVVDRLINDFEEDVDLFEHELEGFLQWCEEQSQRSSQREEQSALAAQGREHLRVAKGVAEEAIARLLEDQDVPQPISELLKSTWKDLLVLIYLKNGQHGQLWQKALNVASLLIWSLLPKSTQGERDQLTTLLPSLLKALQEGMNRMSTSEQEQQEVMALLAREHARLVRDPEMHLDVLASTIPDPQEDNLSEAPELQAQSEEMVSPLDADMQQPAAADPLVAADVAGGAVEQSSPEIKDGRSFMARKVAEINQLISDGRLRVYEEVVMGDPVTGEAAEEDYYVQQARELEEGTWLELTDDSGQPLRAKLSWKSLISGKYFFVNRQGLKVRELTIYGLGAELRAGRAHVIEHVPVFDRAISTLMASLRPEESPSA